MKLKWEYFSYGFTNMTTFFNCFSFNMDEIYAKYDINHHISHSSKTSIENLKYFKYAKYDTIKFHMWSSRYMKQINSSLHYSICSL